VPINHLEIPQSTAISKDVRKGRVGVKQARNQLGTPGGVKSFLTGGLEGFAPLLPPWLRAWG